MRILDLACEAVRHQIYMAKRGFEAHGTDISQIGWYATKEKLKRERLKVFPVKPDMKTLPYRDSCFDAVTCLNAVYHQNLEGTQETLSETRTIARKKVIASQLPI